MGWRLRAVVNTYRDRFGAGKTAQSLATAAVRAGVPSLPQNLSAAPSDQSVQLTWEAPTSNGGAKITGYTYRYSPDGGATWLPSEQGTTVEETTLYVQQTIGELTNGTEYTFQVWANNAQGAGAIAQETATPGVVPPAPRLVRAEASQSSIRLGWTQVSATPRLVGLALVPLRAQPVSSTDQVSGERGAACLLGMSAQKLRYRMRKYGIQRPKPS